MLYNYISSILWEVLPYVAQMQKTKQSWWCLSQYSALYEAKRLANICKGTSAEVTTLLRKSRNYRQKYINQICVFNAAMHRQESENERRPAVS